MRSTATKLFPFLFFSFPEFSDFCRMRPTATNLFPFMFSLLYFSRFFHFSDFFRDASDRHKIVPLPVLLNNSGVFRILPIFAGCVRQPQNCSPSCSSHFRIFQVLPLFRRCPDASDRHNNCSPCYSSDFRIFPVFSDFSNVFRRFPDASDRHKIVPSCSSHFRIFPDTSDVSNVFRRFPDASDRHKIVALPVPQSGYFRFFPDASATKMFRFLFPSFPDFSG